MSLKKFLTAALTPALLAAALAGCGSGSTTGTQSTAAPATEAAQTKSAQTETAEAAQVYDLTAEENTIRFALPAGQVRTAIMTLADELGYYTEEGVNVEFVNSSGTEALTAITTGNSDLDVLGTGIVPTLNFIANGSDLVIYAGTAAEGGCVISLPENVEYYKDLEHYAGARAVMVRNESAWVITRAKLLELGVDVDSIELVEVGDYTNVVQAITKGEADIGFLPTEKATSLAELGTEIVYEVGELDPNYVCCRQVTSSEKLAAKHDAFVRFNIANLRAWEFYSDEANRDYIISVLAEESGQTEEYVENYLFVNRTKLTLDPNESGIISYYNALGDTGYFDTSAVDVAEHIDTSVYAEALSAVLERYPDDAFYQEKLTLYRDYNNALI
ncbi:MAG: ABC transporter substrate-binding protein [Oscillospiraceae bacterium]|nr:ABC transporter substrate-binding protein [Oscillospiraceae bacterium]MCD8256368.1 ABC transporter substrate-binding protein [Oscillospiraceae bacterium]